MLLLLPRRGSSSALELVSHAAVKNVFMGITNLAACFRPLVAFKGDLQRFHGEGASSRLLSARDEGYKH